MSRHSSYMRGAAVRSPTRPGSLPWLVALSLAGFALADALAIYQVLPGFCGALTLGSLASLTAASMTATGSSGLIGGWVIMLLAMMPPLVAAPMDHVLASSLPRRRMRAAGLLLLGYGSVWLVAGLLLIPLSVAAMLALQRAAFPLAFLIAITWSCSPWAKNYTVNISLIRDGIAKSLIEQVPPYRPLYRQIGALPLDRP
jgi:hypothetical protein